MSRKFKIGDRVIFAAGTCRSDTGTITGYHEDHFERADRYWAKCDSDGNVDHISSEYITLLSEEPSQFIPTNSPYQLTAMELMYKAAILSIENGDFDFASKILNVIQGK